MNHEYKSALKIAPPVTLPLSLNSQVVNSAGINSMIDARKTKFPKIKDANARGKTFGIK